MIDDKLKLFDPAEPFVWRLELTEKEFRELESRVLNAVQNKTNLEDKETTVQIIVYLAEWYHRCYASGMPSPLPPFSDKEWQQIWDNAGILADIYVYKDEQDHRRWLYSTYVLGGLAIKHELGRNDNGRFLKGLCRLYHGEEYTLENLDDAARAISFRESISRKHSLYYYLQALLNGDMDEVAKTDAGLDLLLTSLRHADDEVLRQKFRLEWIITCRNGAKALRRSLHLWLKPEEVGGGLNQYLRYERVRLWGITNPGKIRSLTIGLKFWNNGNIIKDIDRDKPLILYCNTGQAETGFVAWGIDKYAEYRDVPLEPFSKIEIVVRTDEQKEYIAQSFEATDWLQLWKTNEYGVEWSSRQMPQHATAVITSSACKIDNSFNPQYLPFINRKGEKSELWQWAYIYDFIQFEVSNGNTITLYNRNGYDQVTTRLYPTLLSYRMGGLVRHQYIDDTDTRDEADEELLPLIFKREDVLVRHFATKDAIINAVPETEESATEVEWKQQNGFYTEWNKTEHPDYGVVGLRITIKGMAYTLRVCYLPSVEENIPLRRDCGKQLVEYADMQGVLQTKADKPLESEKPQQPSLTITVGTETNKFLLDVWRPFKLKEVCKDGKVLYNPVGKFMLPYILKDEITFNEFSEQGYNSYDCKRLGSIYEMSGTGVGAAMKAWEEGTCWHATELDEEAPKSLLVGFGKPKPDGNENVKFFRWNYYADSEPTEESYNDVPVRNTILFQSLKDVDDNLDNIYPIIKWTPFGFNRSKVSLVKCFDIAIEHKLYFFMLKPLADLHTETDYKDKLVTQLSKDRNGKLSKQDLQGLARFREEQGIVTSDL